MGNLKSALSGYYIAQGHRTRFINGMSLNRLALEMWERLDYHGIDSSVLSRVLHGQRLFTPKQLRVFCDILAIPQRDRNILFDALVADTLHESADFFQSSPRVPPRSAFADSQMTMVKFMESDAVNADVKLLFQRLKEKLIPHNGHRCDIGVEFSPHAYYQLVDDGIRLHERQERLMGGFAVAIPGCGFGKTVKGFENNCRCGYHLALYGVIFRALKKGCSPGEIQADINEWISYFFPVDTIIHFLEAAPASDSESQKALGELRRAVFV